VRVGRMFHAGRQMVGHGAEMGKSPGGGTLQASPSADVNAGNRLPQAPLAPLAGRENAPGPLTGAVLSR
jgi:hypothetical protein